MNSPYLSDNAVPTLEDVKDALAENDYTLFEDRLNIIGWRSPFARPDEFEDFITVSFKIGSTWEHVAYAATTVPGKTWLEKSFTPKGTAVLKPGQFIDSFRLGLHKGKEALVQRLPLPVFRDNDFNGRVDIYPDSIGWGMFGINIHRAGKFSHLVGMWSAGCQVFQSEAEFEHFLHLCKRSGQEKFSYTLIDWDYV